MFLLARREPFGGVICTVAPIREQGLCAQRLQRKGFAAQRGEGNSQREEEVVRQRLQWSPYLNCAPCLKVILAVRGTVQIRDYSLMGLSDLPDKCLPVSENKSLLGQS